MLARDLHLLSHRGCWGSEGGVKVQQGRCGVRGEALADCILVCHRGGSAAWNLRIYIVPFRGSSVPCEPLSS